MIYRSDGCCLQQLNEEIGWDDIEFCFSCSEAYAKAYLLNGGPDENPPAGK